jgi:cytochrome c-type biogenesis protein
MVSILDPSLTQPSEITLAVSVWMGILASVSVCAAVRLPLLVAYVTATGTTRRHAAILTALFTLGLAGGTVLLGLTVTPTDGGVHQALQVSKGWFWILGLCLAGAGVLISGLINLQFVPPKWRGVAERLVRTDWPGALLLGLVFGLLQTPVCPTCRAGLLAVVEGAAARGSALYGLLLLLAFTAAMSLTALVAGTLTGLLRPRLLAWLRKWMCSIEPRMQLLIGNVLVVIGIYFVVVG